jgi:hypothetical protein
VSILAAGVTLENIKFVGDGTYYGVGATTIGIQARGAASGANYDVDLTVSRCAFAFLNRGIVQEGKNIVVDDGSIFTNSLNGIYVEGAGTPTDFRGLEVRNNRFHSMSHSGSAIDLTAATPQDFREAIIQNNYFDDSGIMVKGGAIGLVITGNQVYRGYGGQELDVSTLSVAFGYDKTANIISGNIMVGDSSTTIDATGISIKDRSPSGSGNWFISNNLISQYNRHGILVQAVINPVVKENYIHKVATNGAGIYDFISFDADCQRGEISNNYLSGATANVRYIINVLNTSTLRTVVKSNSMPGVGAGKKINYATAITGGDETAGVATIDMVQNGALGASGTFTLTAGDDPPIQRQAATLTSDVTVNFASSKYDGAKFRVIRTGGGAYNLNCVALTGTKTLAQNGWAEFTNSLAAGGWIIIASGSL